MDPYRKGREDLVKGLSDQQLFYRFPRLFQVSTVDASRKGL